MDEQLELREVNDSECAEFLECKRSVDAVYRGPLPEGCEAGYTSMSFDDGSVLIVPFEDDKLFVRERQ